MRLCRKIGCSEEAASTCTFNYPERQVWIGPLLFEPEPGSYDLCEDHANRFVAPVGWMISDLRDQLHQVEKLPA
ncbi:MAG TPA: DUF3499 family protein [Actinomycetota bacterium]|nr:DUF3499 family protein [Actinomycetota bacterium]